MPRPPALLLAVLALVAAGCGSAVEGDDAAAVGAASPTASASASPAAEPTPQASGTAAPAPTQAPAKDGSWVDQAAYEADPATFHAQGDVVLFFNASWCPTCQQTVSNLDAQGVPAGLTVVSIDYDSNDALRQQYGVTVQHTFVQVDEDGEQVSVFTGSLTGAEIAGQTA
jgi:thiol-disulfide isomerase/thioredoxin